jgi:predicted Fe-Mo cluster-binding NifX family protein
LGADEALAEDEEIRTTRMMETDMRKLLIPIQGDFVAPRFDLATEVIIVRFESGMLIGEQKIIIMERASEETLCQMAVEENITDVICGGIEEVHYNFLVWKKVVTLDAVIGSWRTALDKVVAGTLLQGDILIDKSDETLRL